jgi:hypothetical protein
MTGRTSPESNVGASMSRRLHRDGMARGNCEFPQGAVVDAFQSARDKVAIAVSRQELQCGDAPLRDDARFRRVPKSEVVVGEIEIQGREQRLGPFVSDRFGMLSRNEVPVQRVVERGLMTSRVWRAECYTILMTTFPVARPDSE